MSDPIHRQLIFLGHDDVKRQVGGALFAKLSHFEAKHKEANMRALLSFMMCSPGKKLNSAGNDWMNEKAWDDFVGKQIGLQNESDPHSLRQRQLQAMMTELHHLYKTTTALYEKDSNGNDVTWITDPQKQIHAYRRQSKEDASVACFHNFTDEAVTGFIVKIPKHKKTQLAPKEIFNSDASHYGGEGKGSKIISIQEAGDYFEYKVNVPPFSTVMIDEGTVHVKTQKVNEESKGFFSYLKSFFGF